MSIKAVFRVQCDGPCKRFLRNGRVAPAHWGPMYAETWPGERAARTAAIDAGWRFSHDRTKAPYKIYCPKCSPDPYGAARYFPEDRGQVAALIKAQSGSLPLSTLCVCGHVLNWHNQNSLCTAVPGVLGCGCLGFKVQEGWDDQSQPYSGCLTHIAGACDGSTRDCVTQKCRATTPSGDFRCTRPQGHDDEHRNGTLDWF